MPTRLQAAREARGWSQPQLISRLTAKASVDGAHLPGVASLKSMVSRWENGKAQPDAMYARLLREVYGLSDAELGLRISTGSALDVETAANELARHLSTSAGLSMETVKLLQEQTDRYRLLDRPLGAPRLLEQMRGHIAGLSEMLSYGVTGACRRPVAAVLADTAALAGWQALDVGAVAQAWDHFETAKAAAREAEDPALLAYATAEQAYVLLDLDRSRDAAELIAEARREGRSRLPGLMTCWLTAAHGEALAQLGEECPALLAFDRAAAMTVDVSGDTPYLALGDAHLARWRGNALARIGHTEALDCLNVALREMDSSFRRATASLHCDLAIAHLRSGDRDAALHFASTARSIAGEVGSVRQLRRVERLRIAA